MPPADGPFQANDQRSLFMRAKLYALAGLTFLVAAGAAVAYAAAGRAEVAQAAAGGFVCPLTGEELACEKCCPLNGKAVAKTDCCDDPTCPPGCCDDCPPNCKSATASCCPDGDCCPDGGCCETAKPAAKPTAKQFTCPPCPLCPGW